MKFIWLSNKKLFWSSIRIHWITWENVLPLIFSIFVLNLKLWLTVVSWILIFGSINIAQKNQRKKLFKKSNKNWEWKFDSSPSRVILTESDFRFRPLIKSIRIRESNLIENNITFLNWEIIFLHDKRHLIFKIKINT